MSKTSDQLVIRELKIFNWILLGIVSLIIFGTAAYFVVLNQDKINAELISYLNGKSPVLESSVDSDSKIDIDGEVKKIDDTINTSNDSDLTEKELSDSEVGV